MDITQLILDEHAQQRKLFAAIEEIGAGDVPALLKVGTGANDAEHGTVEGETEDAIEDHNDIRDTGEGVDRHPVGSAEWFAAIGECNQANSKHMAEEERQGLTDFRLHAGIEERHALGVRFLAFEAEHRMGMAPVDKDPEGYVKDHEAA